MSSSPVNNLVFWRLFLLKKIWYFFDGARKPHARRCHHGINHTRGARPCRASGDRTCAPVRYLPLPGRRPCQRPRIRVGHVGLDPAAARSPLAWMRTSTGGMYVLDLRVRAHVAASQTAGAMDGWIITMRCDHDHARTGWPTVLTH